MKLHPRAAEFELQSHKKKREPGCVLTIAAMTLTVLLFKKAQPRFLWDAVIKYRDKQPLESAT